MEWKDSTTCSYGYVCSSGNCVTSCTDSDGGKNYYVKGETKDSLGNNGTDYCYGSVNGVFKYVGEFFCENNKQNSEGYYCQNGCIDGACIINTTVTPKPDYIIDEIIFLEYSNSTGLNASVAVNLLYGLKMLVMEMQLTAQC